MIKKMIALWGNNGSGKSTVALALAQSLAKRKQNVVVINTSTTIPMLPIYLPQKQLIGSVASVGALITAKEIDLPRLKGRIHIHPQSDRIGFMALCSGETPISYKGFERENLLQLFQILNDTAFDYILFDCESNPVYDQTTLLALETADHVMRLITPDIQGIEFTKSQLAWLRNSSSFMVEKHVRICSMVTPNSPVEQVGSLIGGFHMTLPFSQEVRDSFHSGDLLSGFSLSSGIAFENQIQELAGLLIG